VEPEALRTLVLIAGVAVLGPFIADGLRRWVRIPAVVVEIAVGILLGPHVLGWAHLDEVLLVLSEMGLVFLIFLAGFEVDPERVRGRPVRLAVIGWGMSLALGFALALVLNLAGVTVGVRYVAIALTTTAIGTLLPILGDAGVLPTRFGAFVLAGGAMGEIGPILAISLALTTDAPLRTSVVLVAFVAVTLAVGWAATRPARPRIVSLIARTLHSSGQVGVRISVLLCVVLVWTASEFGLDILLGAFAAGLVARLFLVEHAAPAVDADAAGAHTGLDHREEVHHRLDAIGFGFFIPLFFVVSGVKFDLDALLDPVELIKVPLFLALFLVVRGLPALLYRRDLPAREVAALGLMQSAALPLLVVITTIGVENGQMQPDNAAGLVGAGLLSVVVLPVVALAVRGSDRAAVAASR
jgi:Kef-type K+ transport system membrane component KefB